MSAEEDKIIDFLKTKAEAAWEQKQPYLLSFAGPDLNSDDIDYQAILAGEGIKKFVERTEGDGRYKLVKHPQQKAKIGIVKHDVTFEFETDDKGPSAHHSKKTDHIQGSVLLDFLDALSKLPLEDINAIVIPTRVLVKLSKKQ